MRDSEAGGRAQLQGGDLEAEKVTIEFREGASGSVRGGRGARLLFRRRRCRSYRRRFGVGGPDEKEEPAETKRHDAGQSKMALPIWPAAWTELQETKNRPKRTDEGSSRHKSLGVERF